MEGVTALLERPVAHTPERVPPDTKDLNLLAELLESRRLRSVIERTYPLCDIAVAMQHLESGLARRKMVITL